ncbi:MAG: right-handed parallel beta-helix repeat-containing protein [Planctomycetota bacterium JB042]
MSRLPIVVAVVLLASAAPALAKKIEVGEGGAFPTIQAGVDAASPGDTVVVAAGVHAENVTIPAPLAGLTLKGAKGAVLDARPLGAAGSGPGLTILAPDVTVRALTIRNARAGETPESGVGVESSGDRVRLLDLEIVGCHDGAARLAGDDVVVTGGRFDANRGGLVIDGASARVEDVRVRTDERDGVRVTGPGARIEDCRVETVFRSGIVVLGDGARIVACRIEGTGLRGVDVLGVDALVRDNEIATTSKEGIRVEGPFPTIRGNRVERSATHLVRVEGNGATVLDNDLERSGADIVALNVRGATDGVVAGNRIRRSGGEGIVIDADSARLTLDGNEVIDGGSFALAAFSLFGDDLIVRDNRVKRYAGDGFRLRGARNLLVGNRALRCARDGFDLQVQAEATELRANVAKKNGAEGFENEAPGVVMIDNVAAGNRIDVANAGTFATFVENAFGGSVATPEID